MSPHAYSETVAQEYFPETADTAANMGYTWRDEQDIHFSGSAYTPLHIDQYQESVVRSETAKAHIDELLAGVLVCTESGRPFKIVSQELVFYLEYNLPIPRRHPDIRNTCRKGHRNPPILYTRNCTSCQAEIATTFAPDRPEQIVCEDCYKRIVY